MNKEQKESAVKEIGERLESSSAVFAVDYRGISVPQAAELRAKLREADASFTIVKNRLAKRITAEAGAEALDEHLVGPTALAYVEGDAVLAAKAINDFIREHEILAYKGGLMDGDPLDSDGFRAIARLPGVDVLRGQLVGLAASPLSGLVSSLNGLVQGLASQLGQIAEQGLIGGDEPAAVEAEGEAGADDDEQDAPETGAAPGDSEPAVDAEPQTETEDGAGEDADGDDKAEDGSGGDAPAETDAEAGEPAPGTGGEADVEAPAEDAGESPNPGGDDDVLPEGDETTSEQAEQSDQGDDEQSDADETDNDDQED